MSWFGGDKENKAPKKKQTSDDSAPPAFSMNELMPPPESPDRAAPPSYLAKEESDPIDGLPRGSGSYLDVDVNKLERERERRELQDSFVNRAQRGELGIQDIPGSRLASSGLVTLGNTIAAPFRAVLDGLGTIFWVGMLMLSLSMAAYAMTELLRANFGYMF